MIERSLTKLRYKISADKFYVPRKKEYSVSISKIEKTLKIALKTGVMRPRDLDNYNIPRKYLYILWKRGLLEKIDTGLYSHPEARVSENRTVVEVSKKLPHSVVCLISALHFHDLTTQLPHQVWVAIDRKAWSGPKLNLPVRIFRFSGKSLTEGIEEHDIEGVKVKIYCPAKSVADCFKYRNKIGLDVAVEALRDCLTRRKAKPSDIIYYARICRISSVIRPYLEVLL